MITYKNDWHWVENKMINEGFHYCFIHYSDFKEIDDNEFHRLRENYIKGAKELETYIKTKRK